MGNLFIVVGTVWNKAHLWMQTLPILSYMYDFPQNHLLVFLSGVYRDGNELTPRSEFRTELPQGLGMFDPVSRFGPTSNK